MSGTATRMANHHDHGRHMDVGIHGHIVHITDIDKVDEHIHEMLKFKRQNMENGARARRAALMGTPPSSMDVLQSQDRMRRLGGPDDPVEVAMNRAMTRVMKAIDTAKMNAKSATMCGRNDMVGHFQASEKMLTALHSELHSTLMHYRDGVETILYPPKSPEEISGDIMNVSTEKEEDMVITYKQNGSNYDVTHMNGTTTLSPHELIKLISQVTEMNKLIPVSIVEV